MSLLEDIKNSAQRITRWRRPSAEQLAALRRHRKPATIRFRDDGMIPNHPRWPLVVYRRAVTLPGTLDPAAVWEDLFESNGWGDCWRGGIYDYLHYHSRIHEVLGVARGSAKVRFGGKRGRTLELKAGDAGLRSRSTSAASGRSGKSPGLARTRYSGPRGRCCNSGKGNADRDAIAGLARMLSASVRRRGD